MRHLIVLLLLAIPAVSQEVSLEIRDPGQSGDSRQADLATWKRIIVYSFGATEGFLLDRMNPNWKTQYFHKMVSTDSYFEPGK
jgi:hypothetical protein